MTQPKLAITQPDGSRRYVHPRTGEKVPSVTTCMKMMAKPVVENWKVTYTTRATVADWDHLNTLWDSDKTDLISTYASNYTGERSALGDEVHELCENMIAGKPASPTKQADSYFSQFIDFVMTEHPVFIESETTVFSREHEYAGTLDLIMRIGNETWLADIKTSKAAYPENALQLAGLANADFILREDGVEEPIPVINRRGILLLRPRSWKLIPVWEWDEAWAAFLACRGLFRWADQVVPRVFLEPAA